MFRRRHCTGLLWASLALTVAAAPQSPRARAAEVSAVPSANPMTSANPTTSADDVVLYDQRQNGTENVRISLSDLKVVLAPADGLFEIMSMAGAQLLNSELFNNAAAFEQRPAAIECTGFKCNTRHRQAGKKNRFKLSSLLAPLLNNQTEQKIVDAESNSTK